MPRYREYDTEDDSALLDGDEAFLGVDMRRDPSQLETGLLSSAKNCRFNHGILETRPGIKKLAWSSRIDRLNPALIRPYGGTVYGAGTWVDSDSIEWIFVAAGGLVYRTRPGSASVPVNLPAGVLITTDCSFLEFTGRLILFRGPDADRLVLEDIDEGFKPIAGVVNMGNAALPNGERGIVVANRVLVPHGRDEVFASDILVYQEGAPTVDDLTISGGTRDDLIGIFKFNDFTIICGKTNSVYVVSGISGPDLSNARLDEITLEYGLKAAKSFAQVGNDVWFLANRRGVVSITQTVQNKLQGVDVPVSQPIQPLIDRIDWLHADIAAASYFDNRYYLAVPLDDSSMGINELVQSGDTYSGFAKNYTVVAGRRYRFVKGAHELNLINSAETINTDRDFIAQNTTISLITATSGTPTVTASLKEVIYVNNAVLVYDFQNQRWSGYDQADGLWVKDWIRVRYGGQNRLFFLSYDGFLNLFEEGDADEQATSAGVVSQEAIETLATTRGYACGSTRPKYFDVLAWNIGTWNPTYSITAQTDGVNERFAKVTARTKSRTIYYKPADQPAYDVTNINDDFFTPYRQDYSMALGETDEINLGTNLVEPDVFQEVSEAEDMSAVLGKYIQAEIRNTQGRIELRSMAAEGRPGPRVMGTII